MSFFDASEFDDLAGQGDVYATSDTSYVDRVPLFEIPSISHVPPLLLAATDDTLIAVTQIDAYRNGLALHLLIGVREGFQQAGIELDLQVLDPRSIRGIEDRSPDAGLPPEILRFGVQYADGAKATNIDRRWRTGEDASPKPHLDLQGGSCLPHQLQLVHWLRPIPPPGPLRFACKWPARGIPETTLQVEAQPLRDASARSLSLWEAS